MATNTLPGSLFSTVVHDVDGVLDDFFIQYRANVSRHASHQRLIDTVQSVVQSGGKRLRPYLFVLAYMSAGKAYRPAILTVAASWELIHQAMLMHDDIIDRDYTRHGVPNVAGTYRQHYGASSHHHHDTEHFADSAALLAGDLAINGAYRLINECDASAEMKVQLTQTLNRTIDQVIIGELQDTESPLEPLDSANALLIAELKTASYSFVGPLTSGAQLAGLDAVVIAGYQAFGTALGIAYQLRDDWLGLFGDAAKTGKSVANDVREGKQNLLAEYAFQTASDNQKAVLESIIGKADATEDEIAAVRAIIIASGAQAKVESQISHYTDSALRTLAALDINEGTKTHLMQLSHKLLRRVQ